MHDWICPKCHTEFEVEEWSPVECPNCRNNKGYWGEEYEEDGPDYWYTFEWD